jgi:hypothetical protein
MQIFIMKREVEERTVLDEFAADFARIVEKHARYIIVSGFVAIAHGRSRGTEDIDMIIERISKERFMALHEELAANGFECVQSDDANEIYREYLSRNDSIRYVRKGAHIPEMELKLSKDILDEHQLRTRKKLPLTGLDLYFSSIEMNIAFKEELLKSKKDIEDAKHMRIVYDGKIDEEEIKKVKGVIRKLRLK